MHYLRVYSQDILSDRKYSVFSKCILIYYLHETKGKKIKSYASHIKSNKEELLWENFWMDCAM